MTTVSRNDVYVRAERGPGWLEDFLRDFANNKVSSTKDILDTINNNKPQTVEGLVQEYRKQTGMDLIGALNDEETIKEASVNEYVKEVKTASFRPLSIRHAEKKETIVDSIKKDQKLLDEVVSLCSGSGGTKPTLTIINFIRERSPDHFISFKDEELKDFIEELKNSHRQHAKENECLDVGNIGTKIDDSDNKADYITHGGGNK